MPKRCNVAVKLGHHTMPHPAFHDRTQRNDPATAERLEEPYMRMVMPAQPRLHMRHQPRLAAGIAQWAPLRNGRHVHRWIRRVWEPAPADFAQVRNQRHLQLRRQPFTPVAEALRALWNTARQCASNAYRNAVFRALRTTTGARHALNPAHLVRRYRSANIVAANALMSIARECGNCSSVSSGVKANDPPEAVIVSEAPTLPPVLKPGCKLSDSISQLGLEPPATGTPSYRAPRDLTRAHRQAPR